MIRHASGTESLALALPLVHAPSLRLIPHLSGGDRLVLRVDGWIDDRVALRDDALAARVVL